MRDESDRELEALLDAALTGYARMEQEDEAAERVQARTMAAVRGSSVSVKKIAWALWALPVAAVLVLAAVLVPVEWHRAEHTAPAPPSSNAALRVPELPAAPGRVLRGEVGPRRVRVADRHGEARHRDVPEALPKLDVFPTPRPLSAEEEMLVVMVRRNPKQAQEAMTMPAPKPIEPLRITPVTIAAIEIPPLNPPEKGEK